jgi:RNA recognition motif-containing protein
MARDAVIYVGNLPGDVREREVEDLFYRMGHIRSIDIKPGFRSGMPAYCFVEYDDPRDASAAVRKMDGYEAFGKRLRVSAGRFAGSGFSVIQHAVVAARPDCSMRDIHVILHLASLRLD